MGDRQTFVCTLVFRRAKAGAQRHSIEAGWRLSSFSKNFSAPGDGACGLRFEALRILFDLVRMTAILCDRCVAALAWDARAEDR